MLNGNSSQIHFFTSPYEILINVKQHIHNSQVMTSKNHRLKPAEQKETGPWGCVDHQPITIMQIDFNVGNKMLERATICSLCIQVLDEFPLNLAQSMERIKKKK